MTDYFLINPYLQQGMTKLLHKFDALSTVFVYLFWVMLLPVLI